MSGTESTESHPVLEEKDPTSARIETQGGTVYWISEADETEARWIVREHLRTNDTNTMVVQKASANTDVDLSDKFRAIIRSNVEIGSPFVLELVEATTRIVSEPVVELEIGDIPSMIFGM